MTRADRLAMMAAVIDAGYRISGVRDVSVTMIVGEAVDLDRALEAALADTLPRHGDTVEAAHAPR